MLTLEPTKPQQQQQQQQPMSLELRYTWGQNNYNCLGRVTDTEFTPQPAHVKVFNVILDRNPRGKVRVFVHKSIRKKQCIFLPSFAQQLTSPTTTTPTLFFNLIWDAVVAFDGCHINCIRCCMVCLCLHLRSVRWLVGMTTRWWQQ